MVICYGHNKNEHIYHYSKKGRMKIKLKVLHLGEDLAYVEVVVLQQRDKRLSVNFSTLPAWLPINAENSREPVASVLT